MHLEKTISAVTAVELKQLLIHLKDVKGICFRFRQLGEMWMKNLMQIENVGDQTVLLYDDIDGKYFLVKINNIIQFEIDLRYQAYQPFFHYQVTPSPELE